MPTDGELKQLHYVRLEKKERWRIECEKRTDEAGKESTEAKVISPLAGTKLVSSQRVRASLASRN